MAGPAPSCRHLESGEAVALAVALAVLPRPQPALGLPRGGAHLGLRGRGRPPSAQPAPSGAAGSGSWAGGELLLGEIVLRVCVVCLPPSPPRRGHAEKEGCVVWGGEACSLQPRFWATSNSALGFWGTPITTGHQEAEPLGSKLQRGSCSGSS